MNITTILSYLVHPGKNEENQPEICGASLPLQGELFDLIKASFNKSVVECDLDIAFNPTHGQQENTCRTEFIQFINSRTIESGHIIAQRLQNVTTHRSGLGLLFIVLGEENSTKRLYVSRFPADFGIRAQESANSLEVELIREIFMRNALSYKAVVFEGTSLLSDFWIGKAIDKQISNKAFEISNYWIREFLLADFRTTNAQGTMRLAKAIKITVDETDDIEIKEELSAAARLSSLLDGQIVSMSNFGERFCLSSKSRGAIISTLTNPSLEFEQFQFSSEEFYKHLKYRTLQIDNGAILTAPIDRFEECFQRNPVEETSNEYTFITRGTIVKEKLSRSAK